MLDRLNYWTINTIMSCTSETHISFHSAVYVQISKTSK